MALPPLLRALRPIQWVKNLVIAGPLLFVPEGWGLAAAWGRTLEAIGAFCLLSGATYLFNDLIDREADQHHPTKRLRPIASGAVSTGQARAALALLLVAGFAWLWSLDRRPPLPIANAPYLLVVATGLAYVLLTVAYSLALKRVPVLDVLILALGFVLRAAAGAAVLQVEVSPWLLLCTFLLLLMVALGKRRWELESLENAHAHRASLAHYSLPLIDQFLGIAAAMTLMAYSLYTFNNPRFREPWLMVTIPFVLYGVMRYLALIHVHGTGGAPEEAILRDKPTLLNLLLWAVAAMVILAVGR
ncbi:MAG TPA: UbiA prenyltransferase family protein [bacterium]|nr:UbiA prenyltransferase family protein [bacterium]